MDLISFDPRLITENKFHDDIRPYRYEQNIQDNKTYVSTMTITMKKMTTIMKNIYLKIKMKIVMK